jgi:hypothetical protein
MLTSRSDEVLDISGSCQRKAAPSAAPRRSELEKQRNRRTRRSPMSVLANMIAPEHTATDDPTFDPIEN